jgi:peptidylprolyl isomerase
MIRRTIRNAGAMALVLAAAALPALDATAAKTMDEVLASSKPADWRVLDPENTLYLDLTAGRVVMELAPEFAPARQNLARPIAEAATASSIRRKRSAAGRN